MSSDSPFNLFNQPQKRPQRPMAAKPGAKLPAASSAQVFSSAKPIESLLDPEIEDILMEIQKKQKEIVSEAEKIQALASEVAKQDVSVYFNNPKNFSPEEWQTIVQNRAELESKAWAVIGKDPRKRVEQKKLEKQEHMRKGKTLGSRRNWMPM